MQKPGSELPVGGSALGDPRGRPAFTHWTGCARLATFPAARARVAGLGEHRGWDHARIGTPRVPEYPLAARPATDEATLAEPYSHGLDETMVRILMRVETYSALFFSAYALWALIS